MSFPSVPSDEDADEADLLDADLLKAVLPPLLKDFQHWFASSVEMLETRKITFLTTEQRQNLLDRVRAAQQQLSAAQMLSSATDSRAGIEMPVVMSWHRLVHECWGVSLRSRQEAQQQAQTDRPPEN